MEDLTEPRRIETKDPQSTLDHVVDYLSGHEVSAVGVASFGPIENDRASDSYGTMLDTPKPGWSHYPVRQTISSALGVPVVLDTDVNGAALGEGRWGASKRLANHTYVTIGTGIGAGVVAGGELLRGNGHPEAGHVPVDRHPDDEFTGNCPFHGGCAEGMAAGPALEARFGPPDSWDQREVSALATHYVAACLAALFYIARPDRIVVGGGVSSLVGFHRELRNQMARRIADYPSPVDLQSLIVPPGLGDRSGLAGGLLLAQSH